MKFEKTPVVVCENTRSTLYSDAQLEEQTQRRLSLQENHHSPIVHTQKALGIHAAW